MPKGLTVLAGRPILAWTLDALHANGIEHVLVIGGWQHERLRSWGSEQRFNPHWEHSGVVRSLQCAADWLAAAPCLVAYGDGAYGPRAIRQALQPSPHDLVVPIDRDWLDLWRRRFDDPLTDAESLRRDGDRLLAIGAKPSDQGDVEAQFMGLLRCTPSAWARIARHVNHLDTLHGARHADAFDMTRLLADLLACGETVGCVDVEGGWVEIDQRSDIDAVDAALDEHGFLHDFRS